MYPPPCLQHVVECSKGSCSPLATVPCSPLAPVPANVRPIAIAAVLLVPFAGRGSHVAACCRGPPLDSSHESHPPIMNSIILASANRSWPAPQGTVHQSPDHLATSPRTSCHHTKFPNQLPTNPKPTANQLPNQLPAVNQFPNMARWWAGPKAIGYVRTRVNSGEVCEVTSAPSTKVNSGEAREEMLAPMSTAAKPAKA